MTTSHHPSEFDSNAGDSGASSPRSDYALPSSHKLHEDYQQGVRFMCSFGGQILPRPHDNQLRYVGGETRIVAVHRSTTFSALLSKLSKLSGTGEISIKYQLPNEDLDALISVTSDEDVENMIEEYDRLTHGLNPKTSRLRLRLFLFPAGSSSSTTNLSSLLGGSNRRENWFFDALNGGSATLERGRSEASSIVSEVPDYLFGLDSSDDTKHKNRPLLAENVSVSDPGSPAPVTSSPYCSTSSSMPDLPPVKTRPEQPIPVVEIRGFGDAGEPLIQQKSGYSGNPVWHYVPESHYPGQPVPVYYVAGHVPSGNIQVQTVPVPASYVPRYPVPAAGQVPIGYRNQGPGVGQVYGGGLRPAATVEGYEVPEGVSQQVYYGARGAGVMQGYHSPELHGSGVETRFGKVSQPQ